RVHSHTLSNGAHLSSFSGHYTRGYAAIKQFSKVVQRFIVKNSSCCLSLYAFSLIIDAFC
ncbi:MAG: hypothetical protein ACQ9IQ_14075, partial [Nitrospirales bacterium]